MLRLFLFGAPRIEQDRQVVPLRRTKALALLAYLAATRQPQDRDTLIALLWPEFDDASARNNLRRELSLLKAALGDELLVADRLQVAWNGQANAWLDVAAFQAQIAILKQHRHAPDELCEACAAALTGAAQLHTDDFMAGFSLPDSSAFDEWQFFQREGLRQQLAEALLSLARWHRRRGEYGAAIQAARRWLALDPLHEPAQRELMRLYAWSGQQAAALRQYEESVRQLDRELGVEPETETIELYEEIKTRRLALPTTAAPSEAAGALRSALSEPELTTHTSKLIPQNFGLPPNIGFVGRQRELADIIRRFTDPTCRLLTLTGPGGIGKTRLALQVAQTLAEGWSGEAAIADGVLFVPLATMHGSAALIAALAAAARFDCAANVSPRQQLLDHLRDKRMLLVLDNFEQLLDQAEFIGELIAAAPGVRLLVTSRVALNLHEEWFHPINGLSFPAEGDDVAGVAQLARFDAIRLFEQRARRVRSDFALGREREQVVRLCRLVAGMPLAIELAASWLKALSVDQVVAALERSLDILTTRDRNTPERHRSMRAVLDESWRLLSAEERLTLARLTIFRGGFSLEGAEAVAETSLPVLAALVDQALLRTVAEGRFELHELLRQYAEERRREMEGEPALAEARHSRFFVELAARAHAELYGPRQQAWVAQLTAEHDNLRVVLSRAQASGDIMTLLRLVGSIWQFWNFRGYRSEGRVWLQAAIEQSVASHEGPACASLRAQALRGAGTLALNQDHYDDARTYFVASLAEYERLEDMQGVQMALNNLGLVESYLGQLREARAYFERSLALFSPSNSDWNLDAVTHNLALVLTQQGDMAGARPLFEKSLALSRARGDTFGILISLVDYASALANHGDYTTAAIFANESLALSREAAITQLNSDALGVLGQIALLQGDTAGARPLLEQGLALSREVDDGKNIPVKILIYLGMASLLEADVPAALGQLREALSIAKAISDGPQIVLALQGLACAAVAWGDVRRAARLFGAGETLARAQGQVLLPAECALTLPYVRAARNAMGARSFATAWAEGMRLTDEAACALALERDWSMGVQSLLAKPATLRSAQSAESPARSRASTCACSSIAAEFCGTPPAP
jgi:predicted ATPase/DNA-binding SARP family transcriptional activator/Tfp pilus assembly protein PilF